ncbi:hypothetical protein AMD00_12170 [Viridibacillus arvi]|uniref:Uncharacterized protein n=1 Tax=Viridibacillus arvi TaxID=263475 RepID=A0A0M0LEJ5_9BACL|nr:hypothetical protein AMD00_12170 [Viridibacillus arvi]
MVAIAIGNAIGGCLGDRKPLIALLSMFSGDGCYLLECKFPTNELLDQFLDDLNKHVNYKLSIVIKK